MPSSPASERRQVAPSSSGTGGTTLFRTEAVVGNQAQWLGTVLLTPRLSHRLFAASALLSIAAIAALLVFGHYTRKARVNGWLVPDLGMIRLVPPQAAVVAEVYVKEGDEVAANTPLVLLSTEVESESVGATRKQIVRRLRDRLDSLKAERVRQQQLFVQQTEQAAARLAALLTERKQLERAIEIQGRRVQFGQTTLVQLRNLRIQQLVTELRLQTAEQDYLDQEVKLKTYDRNLAAVDQELVKLKGEIREQPLRQQTELAETDRKIDQLEAELAEAESRRQILMTAPQAGTVGAMQAVLGGHVNPSMPVLSIVPAGSSLQAQLFSPSRAIGFVHAGQPVLLRYAAFPYQKFGFYDGKVADISRAALSPAELPQQLSGLVSVFGSSEPIYSITVSLAKQTATAYGKAIPLQPGMQVEADVLIERRSLIEWVLDPLFTLTGGPG